MFGVVEKETNNARNTPSQDEGVFFGQKRKEVIDMTTKVIRIMFYDQDQRAFIVDTMEVEEEEGEKEEGSLTDRQNQRNAFSFSTLL